MVSARPNINVLAVASATVAGEIVYKVPKKKIGFRTEPDRLVLVWSNQHKKNPTHSHPIIGSFENRSVQSQVVLSITDS